MEEHLRTLERRWHASGAPEDHADLLRAILKTLPPDPGQIWTIWAAPSIPGLLIYSVRRHGRKTIRAPNIPEQLPLMIGAHQPGQRGLWYLNQEIADVIQRKIPLPPDFVYSRPPRIVRLLRPRGRFYGMEVELPKLDPPRPPAPIPPAADWDEGGAVGPPGDQVSYATGSNEHGWWVFVSTPGGDYIPDPGYESEEEALRCGRDAAIDWLYNNHYRLRDDDSDPDDEDAWIDEDEE